VDILVLTEPKHSVRNLGGYPIQSARRQLSPYLGIYLGIFQILLQVALVHELQDQKGWIVDGHDAEQLDDVRGIDRLHHVGFFQDTLSVLVVGTTELDGTVDHFLVAQLHFAAMHLGIAARADPLLDQDVLSFDFPFIRAKI